MADDDPSPDPDPDPVPDPVPDQLADAPIEIDNPDVVGTARRRYRGAGAALAAGMFGLDIALGTKKKPDSVQIQEAPTDPVDVDADGIRVVIDDQLSVTSPALERLAPVVGTGRRRRSRRR